MKRTALVTALLAIGCFPAMAAEEPPALGSDDIMKLFVNSLPSLKFASDSECSHEDTVADDFAQSLLLVNGNIIYYSELGGAERDPAETPTGPTISATCDAERSCVVDVFNGYEEAYRFQLKGSGKNLKIKDMRVSKSCAN